MNPLPDYGDCLSSDIRLSIWEETVQITVYQDRRFIEGYEMEITSIPTECRTWIKLLERHGQT